MKKGMQGLLSAGGLLLAAGPAWAESLWSEGTVSLGYRQDSLDWNIAGSTAGTNPNVLSELTWRDLEFLQVKGELAGANHNQTYFRGYLAYGLVLDGENQDSDYALDNRTAEFSRSVNGVDGSNTLDISGALGHVLPFGADGRHQFIPLLGYSYHTQNLRMTDGNQVVSDLANAQIYDPTITSMPPLGPFAGLNSSYDTQWHGFWLGADTIFALQDQGTVFARLEAHWVDYLAEADWNLRSDFAHPVSFEHAAEGFGWVLELGWRQPVSNHKWVWGASVVLQQWRTDAGLDWTYFADSSVGVTRLNEVNWESTALNLTLNKSF